MLRERVINVSFSENFAYVLNGWPPNTKLLKRNVKTLVSEEMRRRRLEMLIKS